jgi:hemoglobin-like flavoprotein
MFRDDLAGQGMKFMTTLDVVVQRLDSEEEIEEQYLGLGRLHKTLGIQAADFAPMEEALMDTLRNALGDDFDAELESAWRAAYGTVSANMIQRGKIGD